MKKTGNCALEDKSIAQYKSHYTGLKKFCEIIGDYESLLMLRPNTPIRCPSMNIYTVELFITYKISEPKSKIIANSTSTLLDRFGKEVVDVFGDPVISVGDWNNPKNCDQYSAAITILHSTHDQNGAYVATCDNCLNIPPEERFKDCVFHQGNPCLRRRGDPSKSPYFTNSMTRIKKDRSDYKSRGSTQLLPKEVRAFRSKLVHSNLLIDLQTYVIAIISICFFLRSDEFIEMNYKHLVWDLCIVSKTGVEGLTFLVKGKGDKVYIPLTMWRDDNNPEFCPICHILIYIFF